MVVLMAYWNISMAFTFLYIKLFFRSISRQKWTRHTWYWLQVVVTHQPQSGRGCWFTLWRTWLKIKISWLGGTHGSSLGAVLLFKVLHTSSKLSDCDGIYCLLKQWYSHVTTAVFNGHLKTRTHSTYRMAAAWCRHTKTKAMEECWFLCERQGRRGKRPRCCEISR